MGDQETIPFSFDRVPHPSDSASARSGACTTSLERTGTTRTISSIARSMAQPQPLAHLATELVAVSRRRFSERFDSPFQIDACGAQVVSDDEGTYQLTDRTDLHCQ
jgi:hypothetical protein